MKKNILLLAIILLSISGLSTAQQIKGTKRPLKQLDLTKYPLTKSMKEYIEEHKGAAPLWKSATSVIPTERQTVSPISNEILSQTIKPTDKPISMWKVARADNGTVSWMWNVHSAAALPKVQSIDKKNDGLKILSELKTTLRLEDPAVELQLMSDTKDELGCEHIRYAQTYKNIPIWKRDLYIHFGADDYPYIINGTYEPTPVGMDVTPEIVSQAAVIVSIHDLQTKGEWAPSENAADFIPSMAALPEAKLVLYPVAGAEPTLAYEVTVTANILQSYLYIIDAKTGAILNRIDNYCSLTGDTKSVDLSTINDFSTHTTSDVVFTDNAAPAAQPLAGFTDAQGTDLNGVTQHFRSYQHTDGKYYLLWDLSSFSVGASKLPDEPSGGAITLDLRNHEFGATGSSIFHNLSANNTWNDPAAVSAHFNTSIAYNYYSNTHGRKAIDDKNGAIVSIIHATAAGGGGLDNAFWSFANKLMIYGDGLTDFKPLAGGLDVAGHEMTHGVTANSADLVYQDQAGALNESFSDVFGIMIDPGNLLLGEQVVKSSQFTCLRDMSNPHNPKALADQPSKFSEFVQTTQDNGGVHVNSGITNHAAAILINKLGRSKVEKMYYRALTKYLTRDAHFIDCRRAVIASAKDLDGSGADAAEVAKAFDEVEIFDNTPGGGNDDVGPRTGGAQYIAFFGIDGTVENNGRVGFVDLSNSTATFFTNGFARARIGTGDQSSSIVTTPRDGRHIYFVDVTGHLAYGDVINNLIARFDKLFISSDGDVWNASISPDESFVALTSAYENDPNIYFFDGTALTPFKLLPQENEGGGVSAIDYPDVISWSPNKKLPRLSFDAFNLNIIGGSSYGFWSIYEIDFNAQRTYNMIPGADNTIDIGNICYSNTSPDLVAFNAISNSIEDVLVVNFDQPADKQFFDLGTFNSTINGNPIIDADRPTFSPNDGALCFASPSNNALLFFDAQTSQLQFLQFKGFSLNKPFWGLLGGTESVKYHQKASTISLTVSPSVITATSDIGVTIAEGSDGSIDLLNIYGITVRSIASRHFEAGTTHIGFDKDGLAAGTYLVRLRANGEQTICKVVIE